MTLYEILDLVASFAGILLAGGIIYSINNLTKSIKTGDSVQSIGGSLNIKTKGNGSPAAGRDVSIN